MNMNVFLETQDMEADGNIFKICITDIDKSRNISVKETVFEPQKLTTYTASLHTFSTEFSITTSTGLSSASMLSLQ